MTDLQNYFGPETIYIWLNFAVLPLWLTLILFPNSKISLIFISSIFLPILLTAIYTYVAFQLIIHSNYIAEYFNLYLGIGDLYSLFSNDNSLLIFWIHFIAINLFLGAWVSRDANKFNIPKILSGIFLILIYFTGPLGLVLYWFIRIFYSKKIGLYE